MGFFRRYSQLFLLLSLLATLLFSLGHSPMALAEDPGMLGVSQDDQSYKSLLEPIFGLADSSGHLKDTTPLTGPMGIFNAIVLMFGGIILAYTMLVGTMHTAHDGEMLGKRWSSVWVPFRTAMGVMLVFPMTNGYSAIQGIVLWLILQGVGAANFAWNKFNESDIIVNNFNVQIPVSQMAKAGKALFVNHVCLEAHRQAYHDAGGDSAEMKAVAPSSVYTYEAKMFSETPTDSKNGIIGVSFFRKNTEKKDGLWDITSSAASGTAYALGALVAPKFGGEEICGNVILTMPKLIKFDPAPINGEKMLGVLTIKDQKVNQFRVKYYDMGVAAFTELNAKAQAEAIKLVNNYKEKNCTDLGKCIENKKIYEGLSFDIVNEVQEKYKPKIEGEMNNFLKLEMDNKAFIDAIKQDGWLFAGAYYMQIMRTRGEIANSTKLRVNQDVGDGGAPMIFADTYVGSQLAKGSTADIKDCNDFTQAGWATDAWNTAKNYGSEMVSDGWNSVKGWFGADPPPPPPPQPSQRAGQRILECYIAGWTVGDAFTVTQSMDESFMLNLQNSGANITNRAMNTLLASVGLGMVPYVNEVSTLFLILNLLSIGFLVIGLTLLVYFPMMPYIVWMSTVFGWIVVCAEAVIAAPLWAIMHVHPHGDEFHGKAGQGYTLLTTLIFKPVLMVLGLIMVIVIINPIGNLLNNTFYSVFQITKGSNLGGVFVIITGLIIYTGLLMSLFKKVVGLIHELPDAVVAWIGGQGTLSQHSDMAAEAHSHFMGAVGSFQQSGAQLGQYAGQNNAASRRGKQALSKNLRDGYQNQYDKAKGLMESSNENKRKYGEEILKNMRNQLGDSDFNKLEQDYNDRMAKGGGSSGMASSNHSGPSKETNDSKMTEIAAQLNEANAKARQAESEKNQERQAKQAAESERDRAVSESRGKDGELATLKSQPKPPSAPTQLSLFGEEGK